MRTFTIVATSLLVGLVLFYVVWPIWSVDTLFAALQRNDAAVLSSKIDFPSVRRSLEPAAIREVNRSLDQLGLSGGGVINDELKEQITPTIVKQALDILVTPENIGLIYTEGGDLGDTLYQLVLDTSDALKALAGLIGGNAQGGSGAMELPGGIRIPGLGGFGLEKLLPDVFKSAPEGDGAAAPKHKPRRKKRRRGQALDEDFGFDNLMDIRFLGWGSFEVDVAIDPAARRPDLTAVMTFSGFDWKLTGLRPLR